MPYNHAYSVVSFPKFLFHVIAQVFCQDKSPGLCLPKTWPPPPPYRGRVRRESDPFPFSFFEGAESLHRARRLPPQKKESTVNRLKPNIPKDAMAAMPPRASTAGYRPKSSRRSSGTSCPKVPRIISAPYRKILRFLRRKGIWISPK